MAGIVTDRIKAAWLAFIGSNQPRIDYYTMYAARLIQQNQEGSTVDVQPDDPRIPGMSGIPLRVSPAGCAMKVSIGAYLLVGWDGGDPSKPYASVWNSGANVQELTFNVVPTGKINLAANTHPLPLWDTFESDLTQLLMDISTQLQLGTVGSPIKQQLVGAAVISAKITAFNAKVAGAQYNSQIVSNG